MRLRDFYLPMFILLVVVSILSSCRKYLDKKPDDALVTPESISDLQGLLDDNFSMNIFPYAAETLCDDYYLFNPDWTVVFNNQAEALVQQRQLSTWQRDSTISSYWNDIYENISIVNIALDELPRMHYDPQHPAAYSNVKGSALFLRAFYFYHLAQMFAKPYNKTTATNDLGIALRLTSDINEVSVRASVKATYDQVITDMKEAADLLPLKPLDNIKNRPSLPAAYGMLARTYLSMKEYDSAGRYAGLCLSHHDSLIDFNTLNAAANAPIVRNNKEVIFAAKSSAVINTLGVRARVDTNLCKLYDDADMRKQVFFKAVPSGGVLFKGDYDGMGVVINSSGAITSNSAFYSFTGIVTDEMYLIKAECAARSNNVTSAMQTLNSLLQNRYKTGHFISLTAATANEALTIILRERRKELLRRGARWADIKRLADDEFKITPQRIINSQTYSMPSPYLMLLPKKVIELSGMPQN